MTGIVLNSAWQAMLAGIAWFFHAIGWGGVIVIIAGLMLLAALSANAMKFLSRPRGLAVSAAILLAGLAFVWWNWPAARASTPGPGGGNAATVTQPEGQHAKQEPVTPKAAEASKVVKMPISQASLPWAGPIMPMIAPSPVLVLPPMISQRVKLPPAIVPTPRHVTPHKSQPGHTTVSRGNQSPVKSTLPGRAVPPSGRAAGNPASPDAGFGPAARPQLTSKQQRRLANENYNRAADAQYQRMFGQMMGGMMQPGGMHPMGGHMGGMGHMGGHHR
jgi:hypothetical protein